MWLTFIAINALNLETGMGIGVGISVLVFILQYSQVKATRRISRRSNIVRGFAQRKMLGQNMCRIVALQLSGYIFFGSAVK